jgi:hypothetical protein
MYPNLFQWRATNETAVDLQVGKFVSAQLIETVFEEIKG